MNQGYNVPGFLKTKWKKNLSEELAGREIALTSFSPTTVENLIFSLWLKMKNAPQRDTQNRLSQWPVRMDSGEVNNFNGRL